MDTLRLSKLQLDVLKEIATIGAGNAATGLSAMLNKKVGIQVPSVSVVKLERVPEFLGGPEVLVSAVFFEVTSSFSASMLLLFTYEESLKMSDMLLGKKMGETKVLDEFAQSALKELGNISVGSYLMALSEFINIKFSYSVPGLATDMLQAVLDGQLVQMALQVESLVLCDTEFSLGKNTVRGHFLFMPEPEGLNNIFKALRV